MSDSKNVKGKQVSAKEVDPITMKPKGDRQARKDRQIAKPQPIASGLDWDKIKADFEKVYNPAKNAHAAGRLIARIVVLALKEKELSG